jgi:hypothetical protein
VVLTSFLCNIALRKKLEEKDMEHQANLLKMAENAEAELRQKDIQLAVVEAELCQMQKRFMERSSGLKASTVICQEKVMSTCNSESFSMNGVMFYIRGILSSA